MSVPRSVNTETLVEKEPFNVKNGIFLGGNLLSVEGYFAFGIYRERRFLNKSFRDF